MAHEEDPDHPAPVTIDLGLQKAFEVQMVLGQLVDEGMRVYLVDQSDIGKAAELYPKHCRVLVHAEDEARAREVFTDAGFL